MGAPVEVVEPAEKGEGGDVVEDGHVQPPVVQDRVGGNPEARAEGGPVRDGHHVEGRGRHRRAVDLKDRPKRPVGGEHSEEGLDAAETGKGKQVPVSLEAVHHPPLRPVDTTLRA